MAQKFLTLDEAAEQLGISKDRLSQLREAGKVRAYRDGTSWKFRGDDVERLASDGIPTLDPPSDIDLGSSLSLGLDEDDVVGPASDSAAQGCPCSSSTVAATQRMPSACSSSSIA